MPIHRSQPNAAHGPLELDDRAVLEAVGLNRRFGQTQAVRDFSLKLFSGEIVGLVGPDGAGKTTAIRLAMGLVKPDSGGAFVRGQSLMGSGATLRAMVGYMPQAYSLYGDLSVDENLRFFANMFGLSRSEYAKRRQRLLDMMRLSEFGDRRAEALSGGMYKKLALACALLHRPAVLVLDEPTNGVDPVSRRELWDLLSEFVTGDMAVLLATPYMDEASRCHRVLLMHQGSVLLSGRPDELSEPLEGRTFSLRVPDRSSAEEALQAVDWVVAVSVQGAGLRVVVAPGGTDAVIRFAAERQGRVERVRPHFEDVFLASVAAAEGSVSARSAPDRPASSDTEGAEEEN